MAIEGPLQDIGIHDVFQLLDLARKSGRLTVRSPARDNEGRVYFDKGAVVHATMRDNPHTLGALLSVGVSWALSVVIFDRAPFASALAWRVPVLSAVAITVLAVAIGLAANGRALRAKPIGLLNVAGFYDKLLAFIDHAVQEGFLKRHHADLLHVSDDPAALIDMLARAPRETVDKWSERRERT